MYKKYIFKRLACSFCFYVIWTAILSSCASCPFYYKKKTRREDIKSLTVMLSIFFFCFCFFCFFAEMECLYSLLARENHWPSLFFIFSFSSSVSRLRRERGEGRDGSACCRRAGFYFYFIFIFLFAAVNLSPVYIHSKLYMLVFFFQIKDHELYYVLCHFSKCSVVEREKKKKSLALYEYINSICRDSITSLYVVYQTTQMCQ